MGMLEPQGLALNEYDAYIFDLDGTLVDSEQALKEAFREWCQEKNFDLNTVLNYFRGVRVVDHLHKFAPNLDVEKEVRRLAKIEEEMEGGLFEIEGAKAFINEIENQQRAWAITTSGSDRIARYRLSYTGLPIPKTFITAERVIKGKPDPEPYLKTLDELGVEPERCLVFEDSDGGVLSALNAGCDVVVVGDCCTHDHLRIKARIANYRSLLKELSALGAC